MTGYLASPHLIRYLSGSTKAIGGLLALGKTTAFQSFSKSAWMRGAWARSQDMDLKPGLCHLAETDAFDEVRAGGFMSPTAS
ncbi:MAG: hypothetical protein HKN37_14860 [Rhodothermales bacterium]|nr:hypothetical protein [Rhodothermales bacterium]